MDHAPRDKVLAVLSPGQTGRLLGAPASPFVRRRSRAPASPAARARTASHRDRLAGDGGCQASPPATSLRQIRYNAAVRAGELLRLVRLRHGLTQAQLAARARTSQ